MTTDIHSQLLALGFVVSRVFSTRFNHFVLEYTRPFFDDEIVVCPLPCSIPVMELTCGRSRPLTPAEQVDHWSDLEELRSLQTESYSVWIQGQQGRAHLTHFDSLIELELLFKLCRVDLPQ